MTIYQRKVDTFIASGTWTCPAGVTSVDIDAIGAGGGGSTNVGGGGGGAYAGSTGVSVTPTTGYTITVGTSAANTNGGDSSFDSTVIAKGGLSGTNGGTGGTAAASTGGTKRDGGNGSIGTAARAGGGAAGITAAGSGASGGAPDGGAGGSTTSGSIGKVNGGGGNSQTAAQTAGGRGYVRVTYDVEVTDGFPVVRGRAITRFSGSTHNANMPSGITAGDLLLCVHGITDTATVTTPTGWTLLGGTADSTPDVTSNIFYKVAVGGDTCSIGLSTSRNGAAIVYRIDEYSGIPEMTSSNATTGAPNPPSLTPAGGSNKYLWLTFGVMDWILTTATMGAVPTNFDNQIFVIGATGGISLNAGERRFEGTNQDPGTFSGSSDAYNAYTIAISPRVFNTSLVSRQNSGSVGAVSSRSTPAQAHTTGNLLVATVSRQHGNAITMSDTAGNTWYQAGTDFLEAGNTNTMSIFYAYNITGHASNVVTATLGGGATGAYFVLAVREFDGFGTRDPYVDYEHGDGNGTAPATGSLTSVANDETLVVALTEADGQSITAGSGFTSNVIDSIGYFADSYKVAVGSMTATAVCASGDWRIVAAMFEVPPPVTVDSSRDAEVTGTDAHWQIQRRQDGGSWGDIEALIVIEEGGGVYAYDDPDSLDAGSVYDYRVRNLVENGAWSNIDGITMPGGGGTTVDDSRDAEITGSIAVNDARDAEIHGQATANDARDAEVHGAASANDARDAEITGSQAVNDARDAEIHGVATTNDSRDAEVTGTEAADDDRAAEIHGTADTDDTRDAEITGAITVNDSRDAEVHGVATTNDIRDAEITGSLDDDDERAAEVTGAEGANASRDAEIHGVATTNDARDAEIHGTDDADDSRDAEVTGAISVNDSRDAEIHGVDTEESSRDAEITGSLTANDSRDAEIEGVATTPSSRAAEIHGQATANDSRDAEVTGSQAVNDSRDAEVHGVASINDTRAAEIEGDTALDSSRDAEIHGTADTNDDRAAEVTGTIAVNDSRDAEIHGEDTADDSRDAEVTGAEGADDDRAAEITGSEALDDERTAEVHGTDTDDDSRDAEVFGAISVNDARDAEIRGVEIGISYRGATIWGFIPQIGIQLGVNKNTGLKQGTVVEEVGLNKNTGTKVGTVVDEVGLNKNTGTKMGVSLLEKNY